MANAKKTVKKSTAKVEAAGGTSVPALIGLACLLVLLCIIPWVSVQDGSAPFQVLQVSLAIALALAGGICLGMQIAVNKKRPAKAK